MNLSDSTRPVLETAYDLEMYTNQLLSVSLKNNSATMKVMAHAMIPNKNE